MLARCAEAQAIRKGLPEDLSSTLVAEEIEQVALTLKPAKAAAEGATRERLERIGGNGALIIDWLDAAPLDAVPRPARLPHCRFPPREAGRPSSPHHLAGAQSARVAGIVGARAPLMPSASSRSSKRCWRRTASRRHNAPARKACDFMTAIKASLSRTPSGWR